MRPFVSAPLGSQCGPQNVNQLENGSANPLTGLARALTTDGFRAKQIGSESFSTLKGGYLFSDTINELKGDNWIVKSTNLPDQGISRRQQGPSPLLFDPSTTSLVADFFQNHCNREEVVESQPSTHQKFSSASTTQMHLSKSSPDANTSLATLRTKNFGIQTPYGGYAPWMNYRQRHHLRPLLPQKTGLQSTATTQPSRGVSFDVQLTRDEFFSQIEGQIENFQSLKPDESVTALQDEQDALIANTKAKELAQRLRSVNNQALLDSEFLKFVDALANGEINVENNKVLDMHGKPVDWRATDKSAESTNLMDHLEAAWAEAQEMGVISADEIQRFRDAMAETPNLDVKIGNAMPSSSYEGDMIPASVPVIENQKAYQFQKINPYLNCQTASPTINLMDLAIQLIEKGKNQEAISVLEAEVQNNPHSSEGWRMLGQLLADNEQDVEAIICLKKGHEVDPLNLASLLTLGVSLANEMEAPEALSYLKTWFSHHDQFEHLIPSTDVSFAERIAPINLEQERQQITNLLYKGLEVEPLNADLHVALGVIHNISRQFDKAQNHFIIALEKSSSGEASSIWNKIGATLANSGNSNAALLAYHQALALRPNYPRAWANLGIAHANLGISIQMNPGNNMLESDLMDDALRFYLSALSLNPKATHIWHHVRTAVLHMGRYDLLEQIDRKDIGALEKEIKGVVSLETLPEASVTNWRAQEAIVNRIREAFKSDI